MHQSNNISSATGNFSSHQIMQLSSTGYDVIAAVLIGITVSGTFNNLCVLILMIRDRHLRTSLNTMLLNLSISDLVIATLGTPLAAGASVSHRWIFGQTVCVLYAFAMTFAGIASITSLAVISFQRYILVVHPGTVPTSKKKTIFCVWLYAFLITFPPIIGWNEYQLESSQIACAPNWESTSLRNSSYIVYLFTFGLVIPLIVIMFSYIQILRKVIAQRHTSTGRAVTKGQSRVTKMVLVMIAAFLIAWLPYASVSLIVVFRGENMLPPAAVTAPAILAKSACIYNPVIYVFMNSEIKASFVKLISCGKARLPATGGRFAVKNGTRIQGTELKTGNATFRHSEISAVMSGGAVVSDRFQKDVVKGSLI